MKPILPSRPNHAVLRRGLRDAAIYRFLRTTICPTNVNLPRGVAPRSGAGVAQARPRMPAQRKRARRYWSTGQANSGKLLLRCACIAGVASPRAHPTRKTPLNALDLKGRGAVITGGAAGIGFAIAQRLAASGARLSLWDRDTAALQAAAQKLGTDVHTAQVDIADDAQVQRARDQSVAALKKVDVLVCSAGITGPNATTWEYPVDAWQQVMAINLTGLFLCNRALVPHMM